MRETATDEQCSECNCWAGQGDGIKGECLRYPNPVMKLAGGWCREFELPQSLDPDEVP